MPQYADSEHLLSSGESETHLEEKPLVDEVSGYSLRKRRRVDLYEPEIFATSSDDESIRSSQRNKTSSRAPLRRQIARRQAKQESPGSARYSFRDREKASRNILTYSRFGSQVDSDEDMQQPSRRIEKPYVRTTRTSMRAAASAIKSEDSVEASNMSTAFEDEKRHNLENSRRYSLRARKPTERLVLDSSPQCKSKRSDIFLEYTKRMERKKERRHRPSHFEWEDRTRRSRRRELLYSSDSSDARLSGSDSSSGGLAKLKKPSRRKKDTLPKSINGRPTKKDKLADTNPVEIDKSVTWDKIGGLRSHVLALKEMVMLPLLYPEFFGQFKITPPRGVLFYGPPGCGKTLMARALANSCSTSDGKGTHVSFFMRKGADCLSKWVGEAERQLRLLFEQAKKQQPSIIFFDEIDGLTPVRSAKQDQIHASIVSTLLALMDGLDSRGQVVVIGATNRIDSVDPALRRPGRFDRELAFTLPSTSDRKKILEIHTSAWQPPLTDSFKDEIAKATTGYCGADLKALCAETALKALRRQYPQIYSGQQKYLIDASKVTVMRSDFDVAMQELVPAAHRSNLSYAESLPEHFKFLLGDALQEIIDRVEKVFWPLGSEIDSSEQLVVNKSQAPPPSCDDNTDASVLPPTKDSSIVSNQTHDVPEIFGMQRRAERIASLRKFSNQPRVIIEGSSGMGHKLIAAALLRRLETCMVFSLGLSQLIADKNSSSIEECLIQRFSEATRSVPCVLFLPRIDLWWENVSATAQSLLLSLVFDLPRSLPILFLATTHGSILDLDFQLQELLDDSSAIRLDLQDSRDDQRKNYWHEVLSSCLKAPTNPSKFENCAVDLPLAPVDELEPKMSKDELDAIAEKENHYLRELRIFFDTVLDFCIHQKKYAVFVNLVDEAEIPDYYTIIRNPMCLATMTEKLNDGKYLCLSDFLEDVQQILRNAQEYHPRSSRSRGIAHAAANMQDNILSYAHRFKLMQGYNLFKKCEAIATKRKSACVNSKDIISITKGLAKGFVEQTTCPAVSQVKTRRKSARLNGNDAESIAKSTNDSVPIHTEQLHTISDANSEKCIESDVKHVEKSQSDHPIQTMVFSENDEVFVESRTTPGINKLGGAGFILSCNLQDGVYDVKYVLGGSEKSVDAKYIRKLTDAAIVDSLKAILPEQDDESTHDEFEEEARELSPAEVALEYFNDYIWTVLEPRGWTRGNLDTTPESISKECYFPPGITFENGVASEDYFVSHSAVTAYVKQNRELATECFGGRYFNNENSSDLNPKDTSHTSANVEVTNTDVESPAIIQDNKNVHPTVDADVAIDNVEEPEAALNLNINEVLY